MPRGKIYKHPTKAMHLHVPVPVHDALMRWAELSGTSATRFVIAMLQDNLDTIEAMTRAAEAARANDPKSLDELKALLIQRINSAHAIGHEMEQPQKKRGT